MLINKLQIPVTLLYFRALFYTFTCFVLWNFRLFNRNNQNSLVIIIPNSICGSTDAGHMNCWPTAAVCCPTILCLLQGWVHNQNCRHKTCTYSKTEKCLWCEMFLGGFSHMYIESVSEHLWKCPCLSLQGLKTTQILSENF